MYSIVHVFIVPHFAEGSGLGLVDKELNGSDACFRCYEVLSRLLLATTHRQRWHVDLRRRNCGVEADSIIFGQQACK